MPHPPHRFYYSQCIGRWSCAFGGDVYDFAQLRAAVGVGNAVGLLVISRWPAWLARPRLTTTVSMLAPELFEHTTKVSWLGVPLIWSREELALGPDGRTVEMTSEVRSLPAPWLVERAGGPGSVADDACSATYHIAIYGAQMLQTTRRSADRVVLQQTLPGYRAEQPLERIGESAARPDDADAGPAQP